MEYWDGWFNRWGDEIVRRKPEELADEIYDMLTIGSLNLYMFHGGTNFGFMNGCSARGNTDLPQVTSYDYDALLTEWGQPTEKYFAVQRAIKRAVPSAQQMEPRDRKRKEYGTFPVSKKVSLFATIEKIAKKQCSVYPLTTEAAGSGYGYMFYRTELKNYGRPQKVKLVRTSDRAHLFSDQKQIATQYREQMGEEIEVSGRSETIELDILVENLGRVNYGYKLNAPTQSKGIRGGVMIDLHFHSNWMQYALDFSEESVSKIDFSKNWQPSTPAFYQFKVFIEEEADTFIDCSRYGKGVIMVNGFNIGRYWKKGPVHYLFVPKGLLNRGINEIIIFETEGREITELFLIDEPVYK